MQIPPRKIEIRSYQSPGQTTFVPKRDATKSRIMFVHIYVSSHEHLYSILTEKT